MKTFASDTHTRWVIIVLLALGLTACGPDHHTDAHEGHDAHAGHGDHAGHDAHAGHDEPWEAEVYLDAERVSVLGIRTVVAQPGEVVPPIRVPASVAWDETSLSTVTLRYGGYIERLYVGAEGEPTRQGEPLLEIYSPELVVAFEELMSAVRLERRLEGVTAPYSETAPASLVDAAKRRLAAWEIPDDKVREIIESGQIPQTHIVRASSSAVVVERLVQVGERVAAGAPLFRLAARSPVWVEARVPESDMDRIREGAAATIEMQAYPGRQWTGRVARILPSLDPSTRTARVRIVVPSPTGEVRPGMFASVVLEQPQRATEDMQTVVITRDAIVRAGTRDVVFVEEHPGHFVGREVTLGGASGDQVTVRTGLRAGERVVARGAFLLDAESRLQTGGGIDHAAMGH